MPVLFRGLWPFMRVGAPRVLLPLFLLLLFAGLYLLVPLLGDLRGGGAGGGSGGGLGGVLLVPTVRGLPRAAAVLSGGGGIPVRGGRGGGGGGGVSCVLLFPAIHGLSSSAPSLLFAVPVPVPGVDGKDGVSRTTLRRKENRKREEKEVGEDQ